MVQPIRVSRFLATIVTAIGLSTLSATASQAAIISGQVSGTWQYDYTGGFNVGDTFTANYTYDSDSITTTDYSNSYGYSRYLVQTVPLLSLVLNSGTVSQTFALSSGNYDYLQWYDVQANPANSGQYGYQGTVLYAYDSAASTNYFYAYSQSGQDYYGVPWASNYAGGYAYNSSTGYSLYGYTYAPVTFTQVVAAAPVTAVPTPVLLPGLIGLGLGVWRRRNQTEPEATAD